MKKKYIIERQGNVRIRLEYVENKFEIRFQYSQKFLWFFNTWRSFFGRQYIIELEHDIGDREPMLPYPCRLTSFSYTTGNWNVEIWPRDKFDLAKWVDKVLDEINYDLNEQLKTKNKFESVMNSVHEKGI